MVRRYSSRLLPWKARLRDASSAWQVIRMDSESVSASNLHASGDSPTHASGGIPDVHRSLRTVLSHLLMAVLMPASCSSGVRHHVPFPTPRMR